MALPLRKLGSQGFAVPCLGYGAMGSTAFYTENPSEHEEEALRVLDACIEKGLMIDTAWVYAAKTGEHNETLVGKALAKHGRANCIVATKCGIDFGNPTRQLNATRDAIHMQLSESLARLGTDYVDLYYLHRLDRECRGT